MLSSVPRVWITCGCWVLAIVTASAARADAPRVLSAGKLPNDARLGALKDLNSYFPFTPSKTKAEWEQRAERVRRQLLVANGLWPMPTKTPTNAVIHGKIGRGDYTVEKVYFESYPGHFVTGNLYRPVGKSGKLPGVLCPHGHWSNGRFHDAGLPKTREEISVGAERFEVGGRSPLQSRCVQLARMGCVVFHYDMIGYADSTQLSFDLGHRFSKQRSHMNGPAAWGFYSPLAELHLQSIMGLQTYNSVRALDWLTELPEIDANRIGVTGASGGGTQTFMLCAIDPRPTVAFPAVMVSTGMQGGCTCENCSLLRVDTGNVEFAGLFAPKPLGMSAANDWTKEIATKGLPELQQLYAMLGAPKNVMAKPLLQYGHNYNYVSREVMYHWMNKHLKLGLAEPILEEDYKPLTTEEMSVWNTRHPKPASGEEYEKTLIKSMTDDAQKQIAALTPSDSNSLAQFREIVGGAFDSIIGRGLPKAGDIEYVKVSETEHDGYLLYTALLRNKPVGEEVPTIFLYPQNWNKQVVLWIDGAGKSALFDASGKPNAEVRKLLADGSSVASIDMLYQGESLADGKPLEASRKVNNSREVLAYTSCYNAPLFAQRVHDILTLISFCRGYDKEKAEGLHLLGVNGAGPLVAAAKAQAGDALASVAVDTSGYRFAVIQSISDVNLLPGAVKYGDVPALLALGSPCKLWIAGEGSTAPTLVKAAYDASGAATNVSSYDGPQGGVVKAAVEWLVK